MKHFDLHETLDNIERIILWEFFYESSLDYFESSFLCGNADLVRVLQAVR